MKLQSRGATVESHGNIQMTTNKVERIIPKVNDCLCNDKSVKYSGSLMGNPSHHTSTVWRCQHAAPPPAPLVEGRPVADDPLQNRGQLREQVAGSEVLQRRAAQSGHGGGRFHSGSRRELQPHLLLSNRNASAVTERRKACADGTKSKRTGLPSGIKGTVEILASLSLSSLSGSGEGGVFVVVCVIHCSLSCPTPTPRVARCEML